MEYRSDPRLLFEYQQLLKNSNVCPDERLAVYDRYPELLAERDDCYLDRIVLLCQKGRYPEAITAARAKHFHIYEGGEGNLTKQHAWRHVLYANELARAGKLAEAEQTYLDGVNMPKSYGEAKTFFNQEAHIYYYLGLLLEREGRVDEAQKAFEEASVYKATVSELSLFRALALRKLMRFSQARQVLEEMLTSGEKLIRDCDLRSYYGVGSPTPMPFEYDIVRQNKVNGEILRAYALLGLGRREEAEAQLRDAQESRDATAAELARLREERGAGAGGIAEESRRRYAEQIAALEAQLAPLKEENARYKERETRAAIEAQLVDAARKMDCCETALRDVRRLADALRLDETGRAVDRESRSVEDVLREEIALSPHWLKRSRGVDASPGVDSPSQGSRERFLDAMKRGDFADALRYAPKTPVARTL